MNDASRSLQHIATMPLSLSTMTFTGTWDKGGLPVDDMRLACELAEELGSPLEFLVDCDSTKRRRADANVNKRFRYQLPLKRRGKSIKLFHNGSVHATGCTSPLEFLEMMDALRQFMHETAQVDAQLVGFDIQLINTLFLTVCPGDGSPMTIAPNALLRHLGADKRADFDTERHPSVKIPIFEGDVKVATVCVFQTGSISIMGAKKPEHVAKAFEEVTRALDACADKVCARDRTAKMRTTTAKHAMALVEGYPFNLYACCQA